MLCWELHRGADLTARLSLLSGNIEPLRARHAGRHVRLLALPTGDRVWLVADVIGAPEDASRAIARALEYIAGRACGMQAQRLAL